MNTFRSKTLPNLLIVDDSEENLFLLTTTIGRIKVNLIKAVSGYDAIEKTHDIELAMAIIDVRMPGMSGFELAIKLNENRIGDKIPIIFLTASHFNEMDISMGYESGAVDYIFKPINSQILQSKINVFLDLFNQKQTIIREGILLKKTADELRRTNETLRKSEEKYRSYIENAPDGVLVIDENGRYLEVNEAACKMSGYSEKEFLKMSVSDLIHEDSLEIGLIHFRKITETGILKADLSFKHKNGTKRWLTIEAVKLSDIRYLCFTKDITNRVELEESIVKSRLELEIANEELLETKEEAETASKKYTELFEFAPSGYFILSSKKEIEEKNLSGAQMLGIGKQRSRLINNYFDYYISKSTLPGFQAFFQNVFTTKTKEICEVVIETEDNLPKHVIIEGLVIGNGNQCLINVIDISARKQAEAEIEESREKYRGLSEASFEAIFISEKGKFIEQNQTAERMFGYNSEEALSKDGTDWIVPEDREIVLNNMRSNNEDPYQVIALRKDGTTFPCNIRARMMHYKGRNVRVTSLTDITERKLAEEKVKQITTRLELALRAGRIGVWELDIQNKEINWDDHMYNLYGIKNQDLISSFDSWMSFIHPDDQVLFDKEIQSAMKGEKELDTEYRIYWPDGSNHNIRALAIIVRDDTGQPLRMIGTNWDITEQKRLEDSLKSSETNFRTFFETINDMIFVGTPEGKIIYANNAVSENLDYSAEELLDMYILDVHPRGLRNEAEQIIGEMFSGNRDFCPLPLSKKDGSLLPVETRVWFGKWNGKACIFGYSKDLRAEQEALQKFNKIFDSNPALMAISSMPDGIITDVNETFLSKIEYSKEEIIGKTAHELELFIQPEKQIIAQKELSKHGFIHNLELQIRTKSGRILDGLFSGEIIESQGKTLYLTVMVDITSRKSAENLIKDSESNLAKAQRIAHIGSWEWNILTKTVKWSKEMYNVFDIDPLTYDGSPETIIRILHPDDVGIFTENMKLNIDSGDAPALEYRVIHKDGSIHHIFAEGRMEFDDEGKPIRSIGTVQDITEQKQAKEALVQANSFLDLIFENIPNMVFLKEAEKLNFVRFNKAGEELLGLTREEMIGKNDYDFFPEKQADFFINKDREVLHNRKMLDIYEESIQTKNKGIRILHTKKVSILNSLGEPEYLLGISEDITEQKITEQALKISEEKYKTMLNASPDGILLINLKGTITEASDIGFELFGAESKYELIGRKIFMFVPIEEMKTIREIIDKTMNEGLIQNVGLSLKKKNQTFFAAETSATLIQGPDGMPISFMITVRDISQRKKMEAKQFHADRMANLGEMASGIAHEINQPLNIISLAMDNVLYEIARDDQIRKDYLLKKSDKIFDNIARIRNIIDHVRAFSRSNDDFVLTGFDINTSITNAISMMSEQFKHLAIKIYMKLEENLPPIVGNTFKFEQVILNLLSNAKDALLEKKNDHLSKDDMFVNIISYQENQCLIVEMADNGTGISDVDIENILLPFYTTKDAGKGTGLGLSISYQIIKEMNGIIEIFRNSYGGITIKIILTLHNKKQS
ncbi:MAG: PAS domain S-box protein [Bacteroidales bacterium]